MPILAPLACLFGVPCSMKILRGSKFLRILRIDLDPQKLVPAEKKTRKIKRRKN